MNEARECAFVWIFKMKHRVNDGQDGDVCGLWAAGERTVDDKVGVDTRTVKAALLDIRINAGADGTRGGGSLAT